MGAVTFRRVALRDLLEIRDYIAEDNREAASRLIQHLREYCEKLAKAPLMGRARPELRSDLRSAPFGNYIIFYRVNKDCQPEIMRVLHGARDFNLTLFAE